MLGFLHELLIWNNVVLLMEGVKQQVLVPLRAAAHQRPRLLNRAEWISHTQAKIQCVCVCLRVYR